MGQETKDVVNVQTGNNVFCVVLKVFVSLCLQCLFVYGKGVIRFAVTICNGIADRPQHMFIDVVVCRGACGRGFVALYFSKPLDTCHRQLRTDRVTMLVRPQRRPWGQRWCPSCDPASHCHGVRDAPLCAPLFQQHCQFHKRFVDLERSKMCACSQRLR